MTVRVKGPDGKVIAFPDGTPPEEMQAAMDAHYGAQKPEAPKPKMDRGTAAATGVADAVTFNNTDEFGAPLVSGAVKALGGDFGGAARDVGRAFGGLDVLGMINPMLKPAQDVARASTEASPAEQGAREAIQSTQQQAFKDRPATYLGSQVAATVAIPSASAERGLNWGARTGLAALEGGSLGAKYAEGAAPDGEKGDLGRIATGAAFGAGGGAAGVQLAPVVSWAGKTAGNALQVGMPKFNPNQTNSLFGAMDNSAPPPPKGPTSRQAISRRVVKLADRGGGIEGIQERVSPYRQMKRDPLTFVALGEPGIRSARVNARSPGKTPQAASDAVRVSREAQPRILQEAINEAFPTIKRRAAQSELNKGFGQASDEYNRVLGNAQIDPNQFNRLVPELSKLPDRILSGAEAGIRELADLDGLSPNSLSPAQALHYLKVYVGQSLSGMKREGTDGAVVARLTPWLKRYTQSLDEVIPGYKDVRAKWGDLSEAEEALDFAKTFFSRTDPEDLKADFDAMTQFQKDHALIGIASDLRLRLSEATKTGVTKTNVAKSLMNEAMIDKIKAVLGSDATRLELALKVTDDEFVKMSRIIGGSDTFPDAAEFVDQAMDIAPDMVRGKLSTMADQALGGAVRFVTNPLMEGRRNRMGAEMLQPFTQERQTALEEALRQLYKNREAATRAAGRGGNAGGVAGGSAAGQQ